MPETKIIGTRAFTFDELAQHVRWLECVVTAHETFPGGLAGLRVRALEIARETTISNNPDSHASAVLSNAKTYMDWFVS